MCVHLWVVTNKQGIEPKYIDSSPGIKYEDLAYGTAHGFASMGTNNGHNGTTCITMLNNSDIVEDFSYRA